MPLASCQVGRRCSGWDGKTYWERKWGGRDVLPGSSKERCNFDKEILEVDAGKEQALCALTPDVQEPTHGDWCDHTHRHSIARAVSVLTCVCYDSRRPHSHGNALPTRPWFGPQASIV